MTVYVYDAASAKDINAEVAAGAIGVAVYLTGSFAVSAAWCATIHARGLAVFLNYEQAADELVYAGRAGGQGAGQRALSAAIALGAPANNTCAIAYSVDVNVPGSQFAQVGAAFDGINDVTHGKFQTHVYGEGALIDYLVATGRVTGKQWLSASSSFPGFNPASQNVALVQQVGSPVPNTDQNVVTDINFGGWWPPGSPHSAGVFMALTDRQQADMYNRIMGDAPSGITTGENQAEYNATLNTLSLAGAGLRATTALSAVINDPTSGTHVRVAQLQAAVSTLQTAVDQLHAQIAALTSGSIDPALVTAAATAGARAALDGATITAKAA